MSNSPSDQSPELKNEGGVVPLPTVSTVAGRYVNDDLNGAPSSAQSNAPAGSGRSSGRHRATNTRYASSEFEGELTGAALQKYNKSLPKLGALEKKRQREKAKKEAAAAKGCKGRGDEWKSHREAIS